MKLNFYFIIIFCHLSLVSSFAHAEIQISAYQKKHSWKSEWSQAILDELKKEQYHNGENSMLNIDINEDSLDELDCAGYNEASLEEKSDFWVVFFSALTRAESGFNEKARSRLSRGHRSYGLLQLARQTAKTQCSMNNKVKGDNNNVTNPENNLRCGVKLMSWQLQGAPLASGKQLRSDLEGKIFGKHIFQWGPLRQQDFRGRSLLVKWFKNHLDQLKFCELQ